LKCEAKRAACKLITVITYLEFNFLFIFWAFSCFVIPSRFLEPKRCVEIVILRVLAVVDLHKQTVPSQGYYLIILLTRAKRVPESLSMVNYTIDLHFQLRFTQRPDADIGELRASCFHLA